MKKKIKLPISGKEVEMKPLILNQLKEALKKNQDEIEQSILLTSFSTGLSELDINEMDVRDFSMLQDELKQFMGKPTPQMKI